MVSVKALWEYGYKQEWEAVVMVRGVRPQSRSDSKFIFNEIIWFLIFKNAYRTQSYFLIEILFSLQQDLR